MVFKDSPLGPCLLGRGLVCAWLEGKGRIAALATTGCSIVGGVGGGVEVVVELPGGFTLVVHRGEPLAQDRLRGCGFVVQVHRDLLWRDVVSDEVGGLVYSLLFLEPGRVVAGDGGVVEEARRRLYERIVLEETARLYRLLRRAWSHVLIAPMYPVVARMSRLARLYPWLRPAYSRVLSSREAHVAASRRAREALLGSGLYRARAGFLEPTGPPPPAGHGGLGVPGGLRALSGLTSLWLGMDLGQLVAYSQAVIANIRVKPHPLLRDPLLLARLRGARIATRLLRFEEQFLLLAGVRGLGRPRRRRAEETGIDSVIRSARIVELETSGGRGLPAGVIKDYRGPAAAKWLLAALLTLYLPRPVLDARERLLNEYYHSTVFLERGLPAHRPILVDPRGLRAAYGYVEGRSVAQLLQRDPAPREYRGLGRLLAEVHREGYSLWDTNPSNFIVAPGGEMYMVDLEQARATRGLEERAWDLAMTVYYSAVYNPRGLPERAMLLAEGYLEAGGDRDVVLEASKLKYSIPFLAVVPVNTASKTRRAFHEAVVGPGSNRNII